MKNTKENGITLIALIITIIILLILASISISTVLGDNGIIKRTQETGERWRKAEKDDEESIEKFSDLLVKVEVSQYTEDKINENGEKITGKKLICVYTDSTDTWYKYKDNYMFDISDSGYAPYDGLSYERKYGYFIDSGEEYSKSNIKRVSSEGVTNRVKINYSGDKYDVNRSGKADLNDSVTIIAVMNNKMINNKPYFDGYVEYCFRADVNRDKKVDEEDLEILKKEYLKNN